MALKPCYVPAISGPMGAGLTTDWCISTLTGVNENSSKQSPYHFLKADFFLEFLGWGTRPITQDNYSASLGKPCDNEKLPVWWNFQSVTQNHQRFFYCLTPSRNALNIWFDKIWYYFKRRQSNKKFYLAINWQIYTQKKNWEFDSQTISTLKRNK